MRHFSSKETTRIGILISLLLFCSNTVAAEKYGNAVFGEHMVPPQASSSLGINEVTSPSQEMFKTKSARHAPRNGSRL